MPPKKRGRAPKRGLEPICESPDVSKQVPSIKRQDEPRDANGRTIQEAINHIEDEGMFWAVKRCKLRHPTLSLPSFFCPLSD
jgi:hypothetical protein